GAARPVEPDAPSPDVPPPRVDELEMLVDVGILPRLGLTDPLPAETPPEAVGDAAVVAPGAGEDEDEDTAGPEGRGEDVPPLAAPAPPPPIIHEYVRPPPANPRAVWLANFFRVSSDMFLALTAGPPSLPFLPFLGPPPPPPPPPEPPPLGSPFSSRSSPA